MYFGYATGICSYLKLILSYKFLFFDTIVSYILLLHEQGRKDPRLYFVAKRVREQRCMVNSQLRHTPRDI
jgi:hypothetical protein